MVFNNLNEHCVSELLRCLRNAAAEYICRSVVLTRKNTSQTTNLQLLTSAALSACLRDICFGQSHLFIGETRNETFYEQRVRIEVKDTGDIIVGKAPSIGFVLSFGVGESDVDLAAQFSSKLAANLSEGMHHPACSVFVFEYQVGIVSSLDTEAEKDLLSNFWSRLQATIASDVEAHNPGAEVEFHVLASELDDMPSGQYDIDYGGHISTVCAVLVKHPLNL